MDGLAAGADGLPVEPGGDYQPPAGQLPGPAQRVGALGC